MRNGYINRFGFGGVLVDSTNQLFYSFAVFIDDSKKTSPSSVPKDVIYCKGAVYVNEQRLVLNDNQAQGISL